MNETIKEIIILTQKCRHHVSLFQTRQTSVLSIHTSIHPRHIFLPPSSPLLPHSVCIKLSNYFLPSYTSTCRKLLYSPFLMKSLPFLPEYLQHSHTPTQIHTHAQLHTYTQTALRMYNQQRQPRRSKWTSCVHAALDKAVYTQELWNTTQNNTSYLYNNQ